MAGPQSATAAAGPQGNVNPPSTTPPPAPLTTEGAIGDLPAGWELDILKSIGDANITESEIRELDVWQEVEGGDTRNTARFNPLNTSLQVSGSVNYDSGVTGTGVQAYTSWQMGLNAIADTLLHSGNGQWYQSVVNDLRANAPASQFYADLGVSGWDAGHYQENGGAPGSSLTQAANVTLGTPSQVAINEGNLATQQNPNGLAAGGSSVPSTQVSAQTILNNVLSVLGMVPGDISNYGALSTWVSSELTNYAGAGMDPAGIAAQVAVDMQTPPLQGQQPSAGFQAFSEKYPGIVAQQKAGVPAMSVAQYQDYTTQANAMAAAAGLPKGFMTSEVIGNLISNGISATELSDRITKGYEAVAFGSPNVAQELQTYFPGIFPQGTQLIDPTTGQVSKAGQGALLAYYLDPTKAHDLLMNQLTTAEIGAEGVNTGFGNIPVAQAQALQAAGVTPDVARGTFKGISKLSPLESALPGAPGTSISQQDLINYGFFGTNQQELQNVEQTRTAPFRGGGGFASSAKGVVGAGSASVEGQQGT